MEGKAEYKSFFHEVGVTTLQKSGFELGLLGLKYSVFQKAILQIIFSNFNPVSANPTKWSNTLKQFVGKLPTNCLSVFDHFVGLALKGFIRESGSK